MGNSGAAAYGIWGDVIDTESGILEQTYEIYSCSQHNS